MNVISIERIAADAKVGKQSIYRWWNSKADVLLDAFTERALRRLPMLKPSGHTLADFEALLNLFFDSLRVMSVGKTLRGLIAEAQLDQEFRTKFHAVVVSTRRTMLRDVLLAGIRRGDIRADLDVEMVLDLVYGAFWYRLLSGTIDPLDDAFAASIVNTLKPILIAR